MEPKALIRAMAAQSGLSYRAISERLGRSPSWLSATLAHKGDVQLSTLIEIANACGWTIGAAPVGEDGAYRLPMIPIDSGDAIARPRKITLQITLDPDSEDADKILEAVKAARESGVAKIADCDALIGRISSRADASHTGV